jgi:hypothetical protein
MAKKKAAKKKAFDPLAGYISITDPQQPIIKNDQFGTPTVLTQPQVVPLLQQQGFPYIPEDQVIANIALETTDGIGGISIYAILPGTTFYLTSLTMNLQVLGAVPENKGCRLDYILKSFTSGIICKLLAQAAHTGDCNTITQTYNPPLKFSYNDFNYINVYQEHTNLSSNYTITGFYRYNS